jgi:exodeoxyribonuclease V beta subunit
MNPFDVKTVELSGANLIEASAGTGKTFSIAVLVVRLIIENQIPVSKMLLVTFTDAAAAELKERSIKFIRQTISEFEQLGSSENKILEEIVQNFKGDKTEAKERLYEALLEIDQAMMCTIHSFCQRTLNEFAFETNQAYGKELITDLSAISSKYRHAFIREELSSLPVPILEIVLPIYNAYAGDIINNQLAGKKYICSTDEIDVETCYSKLLEYEAQKTNTIERISLEDMRSKILENGKDVEKYLGFVSSKEEAYSSFLKASTKKFAKLFPVLAEEVIQQNHNVNELKRQLKDWLIRNFINWISTKIEETLKKKNLFTYDDLINQLYEVRMKDNLKQILRAKYDAIFLDEFQDTDQKQYDIFKNLFQEDPTKIVFYIGDPKQSIYSWRKADLNTYYQARNSILESKRFDMKVNFRSNTQLIAALNHFFDPTGDFDTFENGVEATEQNRINYIPVSSAKKESKGLVMEGGEFPPIRVINQHNNNNEIYESIELTLKQLFFGGYTLNDEPVKPSNVCVLTRTNKQGKAVKEILDRLSIPSVISDDSKIINSIEANELCYILEAILTPQKSSIQKAFLTYFLNYTVDDIKALNFDYYIELFSAYGKLWAKDGVYVALNRFITDFNIIQKLQEKKISGQRVISNLKQLIELLQEKELRNSFTPSVTYTFLQNQLHSANDEEVSEYAQRLENDEDTVKIVTIHKSKGMEYDIVLAPFLDFSDAEKYQFSSIRIPREKADNNYVYVTNPIVDETLKQLYTLQQRQENRRLIYVALTRAKYNLFIINKTKNDKHSLAGFIKQIKTPIQGIQLIDREDLEQVTPGRLETGKNDEQATKNPLEKISFSDSNFKKMSYSFLAAHPTKGIKEQREMYEEGSYEQFIFKDLPKGAHVGNLLHDIFEYIDYADETKWRDIIQNLVIRYFPAKKSDPVFLECLFKLVVNTLLTNIQLDNESFQLSSLKRDKRKNEFEFNFAIPNDFSISELENVLEDSREIHTNYNSVKGLMTGFIDLFFEHDGKFYILDWKSNFLGDSIEDYDQVGVAQAMNESNYHLQYLIYALALDKYLTSKLPGFDFDQQFGGVIYLFLRGNRAGEQTGVYAQKVSFLELEKLKNALRLI